ncbi:hypothetical protein FVEG_17217 [Fusarium verticillioides 7600]|uniref:Uncharacterized protein n=1 Tax=Gibberella moniliformis (strain M3125 / FGSC 7600) TaxID=334819 RepID=W7N1K4_GIBM7|nr:hypothetical protein FVEG_17217 [Fusarium verticillioides 7600]EWG53999.1 hypothetical protein FVEG_17217 [Fusarium verticillioides 7600]
MFAPSEDLPKTYGSMTSPQDSTTTSTHEDLSPTDNGKLEPGRTSAKKSLEDQIDDLLATLRDIRSFVLPAFSTSLQNGSAMRIMKTLFDVVCHIAAFLY